MLEGLSTNRRCDTQVDCLVNAAQRFVVRYHSLRTVQPEKRLSPSEAAEVARGGLQIACVYQDRARLEADFGAARGEQDAIAALHAAGQVGQPARSAVYFAVDTDFSLSQLRAVVLPYFDSALRIFSQAGGTQPYLRIGVYGSGLACRIVRERFPGALTWLAEATGWRESKSFVTWNLRQHRNTGQTLCGLGTDFQRCEGRDEFGQWQPVGFEVRQGQGEQRRVKSLRANVRFMPSTEFNTPLATLPQGHPVFVLGESRPGWVRVRSTFGGGELIGHVSASLLEVLVSAPTPAPTSTPTSAPAPVPAPAPAPSVAPTAAPTLKPTAAPAPFATASIPMASLPENNPLAARNKTSGMAHPIGESGRPRRDAAAAAAQRVQQLVAIGDWLRVDTSGRWAPREGKTFCNVYAADFCYLASAYLPRVWWTDASLLRIAQGQGVPVLAESTVRELRADDLFAWLVDIGPRFGWRRVFDASALQAAANAGGVALICADRDAPGRPGHITVVVPEVGAHRAERDADGHVSQPLQTQAGARNLRYGSAGRDWWLGSEFRDRGFFVHA